jgi:hypothetical protein
MTKGSDSAFVPPQGVAACNSSAAFVSQLCHRWNQGSPLFTASGIRHDRVRLVVIWVGLRDAITMAALNAAVAVFVQRIRTWMFAFELHGQAKVIRREGMTSPRDVGPPG